jgi:hypothetical protein
LRALSQADLLRVTSIAWRCGSYRRRSAHWRSLWRLRRRSPGVTIHQHDPAAPRTLEIAPQAKPAVQAPPTELPSEPVLVIPRASRDFVGRWGGRISLTKVRGHFDPPADTIVGLAFGERKGEVFLRTTVFAGPESSLLKTEAEVLNPREVTLTVVGLEIFQRPTIRHVETVRLRLTDENQMEVSKDVNLYFGGYPEPMATASYRGTLHTVSDAEEHALDREILERGELPEATVDEHRRAVPSD